MKNKPGTSFRNRERANSSNMLWFPPQGFRRTANWEVWLFETGPNSTTGGGRGERGWKEGDPAEKVIRAQRDVPPNGMNGSQRPLPLLHHLLPLFLLCIFHVSAFLLLSNWKQIRLWNLSGLSVSDFQREYSSCSESKLWATDRVQTIRQRSEPVKSLRRTKLVFYLQYLIVNCAAALRSAQKKG